MGGCRTFADVKGGQTHFLYSDSRRGYPLRDFSPKSATGYHKWNKPTHRARARGVFFRDRENPSQAVQWEFFKTIVVKDVDGCFFSEGSEEKEDLNFFCGLKSSFFLISPLVLESPWLHSDLG